ncbi:hypothetical protein AA0472_1153 [Acetobacter estunensis NRIC 0472]|uniref:Uncharacterized protein n=1 Tax=Acetobacter estunensis TaxID=104097 RepID=A0A967B5P3_9PROT|nr:hypothetical protein [Acetobacter estunensis]NHO53280.1 hypothetical protein [Acetobacter estunensis]GBQ23591.1 hypothetical protein AA0472_1153 [Acetobacter estunensis NRIC 0472]
MVSTTHINLTDADTSATLVSGQTYVVGNAASSVGDVTAWYDNNLVMTGKADVTVNGYGTTVAFTDTAAGSSVTLNAGGNTIKDLQNGSVNGGSVAGNTFLDLSNTSGSNSSIQVGAYSTFVDGRNLDIIAGAKSTFDGCTGGSITTGSDSHIDKFLQGTITAGIKTVAGEIDTSSVELGRDSTVGKMIDDKLITDGTGVSVGILENSSVNMAQDATGAYTNAGYGQFVVTDSLIGTNLIHAQSVDITMGSRDWNADLEVNTWGDSGSSITGGTGNQHATENGAGKMTFISADSNVHGAFTAVGGSGSDLFVANSSMNMTGGTGGGNTFDIMKTAAGARDVITDFTAAKHNTIDLTGFGLTQSGLADVLDHATVSSAGLALHLNSNTTLTVADVHDTNTLTASNFSLLS